MADLNRRVMLQYLSAAAGFAAIGTATLRAHGEAGGKVRAGRMPADPAVDFLTPLRPGMQLGGMTLAYVVDDRGTLRVDLRDSEQRIRMVRLCRRDPDPRAPAPVARTRHYDIYIVNGGAGDKTTADADARLVEAVAKLVRGHLKRSALVTRTIRERWALGSGV